MQHQQQQNDSEVEGPAVNGVSQSQLNGSLSDVNVSESNKSSANGQIAHNGVIESSKDSVSKPTLSGIDQEIVRLIGQHLIRLGLQ